MDWLEGMNQAVAYIEKIGQGRYSMKLYHV